MDVSKVFKEKEIGEVALRLIRAQNRLPALLDHAFPGIIGQRERENMARSVSQAWLIRSDLDSASRRITEYINSVSMFCRESLGAEERRRAEELNKPVCTECCQHGAGRGTGHSNPNCRYAGFLRG